MNKLILARHCLRDEHGGLSALGVRQADTLAAEVKRVVNGKPHYIVSASSRRAVETAGPISLALGGNGNFEMLDYLWSAVDGPAGNYTLDKNLARLVEIVTERKGNADNLVVVGHLESITDLAQYFAKQVLGRKLDVEEIKVGSGVMYDFVKWSYESFPRGL